MRDQVSYTTTPRGGSVFSEMSVRDEAGEEVFNLHRDPADNELRIMVRGKGFHEVIYLNAPFLGTEIKVRRV